MIGAETKALGIIFPNMYDKLVPELANERLMASIPFASRYRLIDFVLSSMVNSDITNISILAREKYFSLIDHLGSGREWDLARKNGGVNIFPPFAEKSMAVYGGRVDALMSIIGFLKKQKEKYVVMSDTNIAYNINFKEIIEAHITSGADVTVVYSKEGLPGNAIEAQSADKGLYYTIDLDGDHVTDIHINPRMRGVVNFDMNIYVIDRELLISLVEESALRGGTVFERDILLPQIGKLRIVGFECTGYVARISGLASYFAENMKLLDDENLDALFSPAPVYTKIRDDNPTRYIGAAKAENVMVADGCRIEGTIENCVLFRGVTVGKGAVVKNCVLMQDTVVEENANIEYIVTDKNVTITHDKMLKGTESFPVFIAKGNKI